jgi:hypothetical protein
MNPPGHIDVGPVLMGVTGFLKNAAQLRMFGHFVELDIRDGIPPPPEQLMEWQQFQRITNQYDSVQTLVQLAGNKLISISDTSFFMEEACLGVEHPEELISSMLPSAGYLQRFCIHINMNTSSSDVDEVIFHVVAKSVNDYICGCKECKRLYLQGHHLSSHSDCAAGYKCGKIFAGKFQPVSVRLDVIPFFACSNTLMRMYDHCLQHAYKQE